MLFINISSDKTLFQTNDEKIFLERNNLERTFSQKLKDIFDKQFFTDIFVLNGPGSFTSLRIGTLSLNLLNFFYGNKINFWNISKINLYKKFVEKGFLPSKGIIFIGQQKNIWLYDFDTDKYEQRKVEEIGNIDEQYFIDQMFGEQKNLLDSSKIIQIEIEDQKIRISFGEKSSQEDIQNLGIIPAFEFSPNYMIAPNIS